MKTIISIILLAVLIISCAPVLPANSANKSPESPKQIVIVNLSVNNTNSTNVTVTLPVQTQNQTTLALTNASTPHKEAVEGELVNFPSLRASDPDGDPITYTFSKPLNEKGEWRTKEGDVLYQAIRQQKQKN